MRAIVGVLGLALAAVALAPSEARAEKPLAHQKSCDRAKAPSVQGRPGLAVIAPAGAAEVFPARWSSSCRNTNTRGQDTIYDYGLVDAATGAVIVPYAYDAVVPYSKTGALVQREDKTWTTFVAGKGEQKGKLNLARAEWLNGSFGCDNPAKKPVRFDWAGPVAAVGYSAPDAAGRVDAMVFFGDGAPASLPRIGGVGIDKPVRRLGDVLLVEWIDPEGARRARLHALTGAPVSPVLGEVAPWVVEVDAWAHEDKIRLSAGCYGVASLDFFLTTFSLDRDPAQESAGALLVPITATGEAAVLPAGAVGMFPVTAELPSQILAKARANTHFDKISGLRAGVAFGWAVVFPTADGYEFTVSPGTPARALAEAATAPRYRDYTRLAQPIEARVDRAPTGFAARTADGRWQVFQYRNPSPVIPADANLQVAIQRSMEASAVEIAANLAAIREQVASREAAYVAAYEKNRAEGRQCNYVPPWGLPMNILVDHATACPGQWTYQDITRLIGQGAPVEVTDRLMANYGARVAFDNARRAEQAAAAAAYVPPVNWETAMRLGGDAWVANINQSSQNWLDGRKAQYQADWQRSQRAY